MSEEKKVDENFEAYKLEVQARVEEIAELINNDEGRLREGVIDGITQTLSNLMVLYVRNSDLPAAATEKQVTNTIGFVANNASLAFHTKFGKTLFGLEEPEELEE